MKRFMTVALVAMLLPLSAGVATGITYGSPHRFGSKEAELRYWLQAYLLDPEWLRVAKLEAGAQLSSNVALQAHNYFGLHRAYSRPTTALGHFGVYARYPSMQACVQDVAEWAQMSPRRPGEPFDRWLKRRGWNHLPHYFRTLARVRLPGEPAPNA